MGKKSEMKMQKFCWFFFSSKWLSNRICYVGFIYDCVCMIFYQFIVYFWYLVEMFWFILYMVCSTVVKSNAIIKMNKWRWKKHTKNQMSSPMVSYNVYTYEFKTDTIHSQMWHLCLENWFFASIFFSQICY